MSEENPGFSSNTLKPTLIMCQNITYQKEICTEPECKKKQFKNLGIRKTLITKNGPTSPFLAYGSKEL